MTPLALGLDLVEVSRVRETLNRFSERFKERTFTPGEQAYCDGMADPAMHYAARFAAKEAVAKVLGTGFADGVSWTDIEVTRDEYGAPHIALHRGAAKRASHLGIERILISLTHTSDHAAANAIGLSAK